MKLLHWHKLANEAALKAALIRTKRLRDKDKQVMSQSKAAEKAAWMQRVVEEEQMKPLEVTDDFIRQYEQQERAESEKLEAEVERHIKNLQQLKQNLTEREELTKRCVVAGYGGRAWLHVHTVAHIRCRRPQPRGVPQEEETVGDDSHYCGWTRAVARGGHPPRPQRLGRRGRRRDRRRLVEQAGGAGEADRAAGGERSPTVRPAPYTGLLTPLRPLWRLHRHVRHGAGVPQEADGDAAGRAGEDRVQRADGGQVAGTVAWLHTRISAPPGACTGAAAARRQGARQERPPGRHHQQLDAGAEGEGAVPPAPQPAAPGAEQGPGLCSPAPVRSTRTRTRTRRVHTARGAPHTRRRRCEAAAGPRCRRPPAVPRRAQAVRERAGQRAAVAGGCAVWVQRPWHRRRRRAGHRRPHRWPHRWPHHRVAVGEPTWLQHAQHAGCGVEATDRAVVQVLHAWRQLSHAATGGVAPTCRPVGADDEPAPSPHGQHGTSAQPHTHTHTHTPCWCRHPAASTHIYPWCCVLVVVCACACCFLSCWPGLLNRHALGAVASPGQAPRPLLPHVPPLADVPLPRKPRRSTPAVGGALASPPASAPPGGSSGRLGPRRQHARGLVAACPAAA